MSLDLYIAWIATVATIIFGLFVFLIVPLFLVMDIYSQKKKASKNEDSTSE